MILKTDIKKLAEKFWDMQVFHELKFDKNDWPKIERLIKETMFSFAGWLDGADDVLMDDFERKVLYILNKEIKCWRSYMGEADSKEYKLGFIMGLNQAKRAILSFTEDEK